MHSLFFFSISALIAEFRLCSGGAFGFMATSACQSAAGICRSKRRMKHPILCLFVRPSPAQVTKKKFLLVKDLVIDF